MEFWFLLLYWFKNKLAVIFPHAIAMDYIVQKRDI